jgi:hypothetical protein
MENFPVITLSDAVASLERRPALLLGPAATRAPDELGLIVREALRSTKLTELSEGIDENNFGPLLDMIRIERPDKASSLEGKIRESILHIKPAPDINHLAKALWSACISVTEDLTFESALRNYLDSIPGTRSLTIVDEERITPPNRTIPVYKLLGNAMSSAPEATLALSESDQLLRQQVWRDLLVTFADHVRGAPVFVIGFGHKVTVARAVLGMLQSMPHPRPSHLLFLKNDPALADATVVGLCKKFKTNVVDASLRDLASQISGFKLSSTLATSPAASTNYVAVADIVEKHSGVLVLVPGSKGLPPLSPMELPHAVEALFRPAANDWRPFQHDMDVRRTVTDKLLDGLSELVAEVNTNGTRVLLVHGEAGVGKTTALKRLAMEAADQGLISLWCTRASSGSNLRALRNAAKELGDWKKEEKSPTRFVLFCDDPWGLRVDIGELATAFDGLNAPLVLVVCVRNTEYGATDANNIANLISIDRDLAIPYELDSLEMSLLAKTLVKIGATKDVESARREISRVPTKHATDILCNLWYLIPETRLQFAESLRDEYCRLGAVRDAVGTMAANAASEGGAIAIAAYEFVTVTSNLNIGLPIEVLVHALQIDYEDWTDTVGAGKPLWGLLYDVSDEEHDTVTYFTRNEIVTKLLLELVNGAVGHAGEFGVLKRLLAACSGGSMVYRSFALNVLVRGRKRLAEFLTYEQGLELFDIAAEALPFEDRVIEHQRGIWIQDVGRKDDLAYKQFEKALATEIYPGSDRDAPKEHIHTSMAAAVLKLIKNGQQDRERGMLIIKEHLRQASSNRFFNAHTSHVSAGVLFEIARLSGLSSSDPEGFTYVVAALQEIERARQIVGSQGGVRLNKDMEMMADLEKRVINSIPRTDQLVALASELFDKTKNQVGFEVAARRMLVEASAASKGKDFNEVNDYLNECMVVIERHGSAPSTDLTVVRIDLLIRWTVQGFKPVPWEALRDDLADVLKDARYRDDVIRTFFYAVTLYHCGEMTEANALFATIRRWQPVAFGLREIRCFFLGPDGNPRRFQGIFKKEHMRWYFEVPELNAALHSRAPQSFGSGATGHAYISFSLNGPLVQEGRPDKEELSRW